MKKKLLKYMSFWGLLFAYSLFLTSCQETTYQWSKDAAGSVESVFQTKESEQKVDLKIDDETKELVIDELVSTEEEYSFTEEKSGDYAYNSLNEWEKVWYQDINDIIGKMKEKEELSIEGIDAGLNETHIDHIFQCVLNDHPEYFFVEGYTYTKYTRGERLVKIEFSGTYGMEIEEAKIRRQQIQYYAYEMLRGVDASALEYDKVKYVYETVILNTDYNLDAEDNQNIFSVFVNKESVCQGYAKATQYLLHQLDVECTMVMGVVNTGEGHAWNLVNVDGSYYYLDSTWGDASYQMDETEGEEEYGTPPEINYDYLCVTTKQLTRTHVIGGVVPMPECIALEANYYVREGVYFTSCDTEKLEQVFEDAMERGKSDITLKCADGQTYQDMNQYLINEQGIFEYLNSPDGIINYAQNDNQLSMTFWMTNE